jgi:hypothetical protein
VQTMTSHHGLADGAQAHAVEVHHEAPAACGSQRGNAWHEELRRWGALRPGRLRCDVGHHWGARHGSPVCL